MPDMLGNAQLGFEPVHDCVFRPVKLEWLVQKVYILYDFF